MIAALTLGIATAAVVLPIVADLRAARAVLDGPVDRLDAGAIRAARDHLRQASARLGSAPAKLVELVPVIGANMRALEAVADGLPKVLDTGLDLAERIDATEEKGFLDHGKADLQALQALRAPLDAQAEVLSRFADDLSRHLNGWLVPLLWSQVDSLYQEVNELETTARKASDFVRISGRLFGADGRRTYLVLLLNNAELRGAGGIVSGVGTLSVDDGTVSLGEFRSVHDLQVSPRRVVQAPPEYERRYGIFGANSTLWLNTSYSPDVPDVAEVGARLYRKSTGIDTDGAMVLDPIGIAALLDEDEELEVTGEDEKIGARDLPRFVYSDAYDRFTDQSERQDALLATGRLALERLLITGMTEGSLKAAAAATQGGHISFVSFDRDEGEVLADIGISRDLTSPSGDAVLVVVQNRGGGGGDGNKLDYWAAREVKHVCDVVPGSAACGTEVRLNNESPGDLTKYVAGRPYGLLRSYVETYVPGDAQVTAVELDSEPVEFRQESQSGYTSIGVYVEISPTEAANITVRYDLPLKASGYQVEVTPQPLARDALFELVVRVPSGWTETGPGSVEDDILRYSGPLQRSLTVAINPPRVRGLSALWQGLGDFWRQPLFD